MNYKVELEIYRGADVQPRYRTTYDVVEDAPLGAMSKAERSLNVILPDDEYAVSLIAIPVLEPLPQYAEVLDRAA